VSTVHLLVPEGIDDPARPSGGNSYDRRLGQELAGQGWQVHRHLIAGCWPDPDVAAGTAVGRLVAELPDGALVLIDGLLAASAAAALLAQAGRLRLVVLVHMLHPGDQAVLAAASAVITTSCWTRDELLARQPLAAEVVRVARPGAQRAEPAAGSAAGNRLLCVAALVPHKGQDLLVAALAILADRPWRCSLIGPLDRDPAFVEQVRRQVTAAGLAERVEFAGPAAGRALSRAYRSADLLVLPSRAESYGMVVTEALGHALPVLATAVGGVPEAMGDDPPQAVARAGDGSLPGLLVPPEDPAALATALRRWLDDAELRSRLRSAARQRRKTLAGWPETAERVGAVLAEVAAAEG
jgi:glycosyltransferase involved in cell wall biosynthesis